MNYLLYIAILPVALLLYYIYKKDTHKEPGNVLAKIFFFGVLAIIPAGILEVIVGPFFPIENYRSIPLLFLNVFIAVALIEEFVKWLVIKLIIYKSEHFDETFDGIVYAVFASLGFACLENIMYVITSGAGTGIVRAVTAVPLHACTGIIMGYFIGKAKLSAKNGQASQETTNIILSLLIPTTVHAIYDGLIFTKRMEFIIAWGVFIIAIYIICFILVKKSTNSNESTETVSVVKTIPVTDSTESINNEAPVIEPAPQIITQEVTDQNTDNSKGIFCTHCGNKIDGSNFCPKCGHKNN
ncbi:MAG: PrsW family intramembrane metalloprotease [Bacilli bacterium]|nr:PrsW family intramembrane metalloprotease [Bacilli bacterium]